MTSPIESRHIRIEELAEGVFAAIHCEGGWAITNAGIVDLGDETLIFDTLMTPAAAADLRQAAVQLTGRPGSYVVNSHYHNDHIWGNQVFVDEAIFISSSDTRALILTEGQAEYDWFATNAQERFRLLADQVVRVSDEDERAGLQNMMDYYEAVVESLPILEKRIPSVVFDETLVLHGSCRSAELISLGPGHTGNDVILHLPDDGVAMLADILFVQAHPWLPDGDVEGWLRALDRVAALDVKTLVPGHGPVGTPADLEKMKRYITELRILAANSSKDSSVAVTAGESEIPDVYSSWKLPEFYMPNLSYLRQRQPED